MFACCVVQPEQDDFAVEPDGLNAQIGMNSNGIGGETEHVTVTNSVLFSANFVEETKSREELAWVNHAVRHLWPELDKTIWHIVEHKILPGIKERATTKVQQIEDIKFSKFSLGHCPPVIEKVRVTQLPYGDTKVRVWFEYKSDMFVEMEIKSNIAAIGTVHCGIKDLKVKGNAVGILSPYVDSMPGTGSVSVFCVELPDIDFQFSGSASIINKLGVKGIILNVMSSVLEKKIVLPNMVTLNIGLTDFKVYPPVFEQPEPVAMLRVTLQKGSLRSGTNTQKSGFSISRSVDNVFEYFDTKLGKMMGKDMSEYFRFRLGEDVWEPKVNSTGLTYDFEIVDIEQLLHMSVWDTDFINQDDEIGTAGPYTLQELPALVNKPVGFLDAEGLESAQAVLSFQYFEVARDQLDLAVETSMVIIGVRELRKPGPLPAGCKLALRGKLGKTEKTSHFGAVIKDQFQLPAVKAAMAQVRQNLTNAQVDQATIDKVLSLEVEVARVSINGSVCIDFPSAQLKTLDLELYIIDRSKDNKGKMVDKVLGQTNVTLADIDVATGKSGPVIFDTEIGQIEAEVDISLCALIPTIAPVSTPRIPGHVARKAGQSPPSQEDRASCPA
eukprot:TRINITY_DN91029_c0_g1_i1.p1 TRINITY_DN91029_c0_g1~~TRINITY_DN91029_c0_g1_i1.p1  ORF type:complete len:611 (-),score=105.39 TRINITY_DN91029_c0_g1_i1:83-1915(-)